MGVKLDVAFGVLVVVAGFATFTICQINFFPLLTHFKETVPDFEVVATFGHGLPGELLAAKAKGEERRARAKIAEVITSDDFLREAFMRKTVPAKECWH